MHSPHVRPADRAFRLLAFIGCVATAVACFQRSLAPTGCLADTGLAHLVSTGNRNVISVSMSDDLSPDKVTIRWHGYASDALLVSGGSPREELPAEYGENDFSIEYAGKVVGRFRQFKRNDWHSHRYHFSFRPTAEGVVCDVKIDGPDNLSLSGETLANEPNLRQRKDEP
jgi:hypothetical protein